MGPEESVFDRSFDESPVVTNVLGSPLTLGTVSGDVLKDETGWNEAQLELRVHGPLGQGTAHVIAGRGKGQWIFDTLEVLASELHKKINVISGSVVEYEPGAYVDVHTQVARVGSKEMPIEVPPPSWNGEYRCIYATVAGHKIAPTLGQCVLGQRNTDPIERYEADLRYGSFVMRETDLYAAGSVEIPLTRTYTSTDWMHPNHVHAFGQNTNHPFDIAPVGSRNPYKLSPATRTAHCVHRLRIEWTVKGRFYPIHKNKPQRISLRWARRQPWARSRGARRSVRADVGRHVSLQNLVGMATKLL